jgi:hypothetical protein
MSKTVRVRIAVVVDNNGDYGAFGASRQTDNDLLSFANEIIFGEQTGLWDAQVQHWCEVDIPIPEPQTIEGEVVG